MPPAAGLSARRSGEGEASCADASGRSMKNSVSPLCAAKCRRRSVSLRAWVCHRSKAPQLPLRSTDTQVFTQWTNVSPYRSIGYLLLACPSKSPTHGLSSGNKKQLHDVGFRLSPIDCRQCFPKFKVNIKVQVVAYIECLQLPKKTIFSDITRRGDPETVAIP